MTTEFVILPPISASELRRLEGVREHDGCLVDGDDNYLAVETGDDGNVEFLLGNARGGDPGGIIDAIETAFPGSRVYSEHEPQYYGFETREEWDLAEWEHIEKRPLEVGDMIDRVLEVFAIFHSGEPYYVASDGQDFATLQQSEKASPCDYVGAFAEEIARKWPKRLSELGVSGAELTDLIEARVRTAA
jgi:hypothetical protein